MPTMKQGRLRLILLLFLISSLLPISAVCQDKSPSQPRISKAILDLREWDFAKGQVSLNGEWQFYWSHFLELNELEQQVPSPIYINVSKAWNQQSNLSFNRYGFASYRLTLLLPSIKQIYGIRLPPLYSAYWVRIENSTLQRGELGKSAEEMVPHFLGGILFFKPSQEKVELVIQVSNFMYSKGGIANELKIGTAQQISSLGEWKRSRNLIGFGILISISLYSLFFVLLRKQGPPLLYFSLFTFLLAFQSLTRGEHYLAELFSLIPWVIAIKFNYISSYLLLPLILAFVGGAYPNEVNSKTFRYFLFITIPFILISLFFRPGIIPYSFLQIYFVVVIFGLITCFLIYFKAYTRDKEKKGLTDNQKQVLLGGFSFLLLGVTALNDMLYDDGTISTLYLNLWGGVGFSSLQVILLSMKFSNTLQSSEPQKTQFNGEAQELEAFNRELLRMNRIKEEFLSNTSHEFKAPLNGMIGIAESILEGRSKKFPQKNVEALELIIQNGKRLFYLINHVLDMVKLKNNDLSLSLQSVEIKDIVRQSLQLSSYSLRGKKLEFHNYLDRKLPSVLADPNRIRQIFDNLLGNAIKYTPNGVISISAEVKGKDLEICVRDSGIGISEENLEKIFSRFEKGDSKEEGVGLGLAITRELVELHRGKIWVESIVNQGSSFFFTLPITVERKNVLEGEVLPDIPRSVNFKFSGRERVSVKSGGKQILIVDDNEESLQIVVSQLSREKFDIQQVKSGEEALQVLQSHKPDLILLDIMMPGISGIELCRALREKYTKLELPIIFQTCKDSDADLQAALAAGGNDYIIKPFSKVQLLSRIRSLFATVNQSKEIPEEIIGIVPFLEQMVYIQSQGDFIEIYSYKNRFPLAENRITLENLMVYFPKKLIRIHKSYLVNIDCIKEVKRNQRTNFFEFKEKFDQKIELKLSRLYKKSFQEQYPQFF